MGIASIFRFGGYTSVDAPAPLVRTEKRLIHGQLVDVKIYGHGSGGEPRPKPDAELRRSIRLFRAKARERFTPKLELCYLGLPHLPAADFLGNEHTVRSGD
jgi:hypothetical protein